jgi:hypothetical protein
MSGAQIMRIAPAFAFAAALTAMTAALTAAAPALASTYTFDTAAELTDTFNLDVIGGDFGTQHRSGYAAQGGFAGSDGGFVHLNYFDSGNSLQFKSGPAMLTSLSLSAAYAASGAGAMQASRGGMDIVLTLYDEGLSQIYSATHLMAENGVWETLELNVARVSVIQIAARWSAHGVYDGFWPNIDNIVTADTPIDVVSNQVASVPVPAAAPLLAGALGALSLLRRRRKG